MASVLLFLLVGASILNVCVESSMTGRRALQAFTAFNLAKSHIDELRNLPYSSLTSTAETDTEIDASGAPDPDGAFFRTTTVSTSYGGDANLTQVVVSVRYRLKGTVGTRSMSLTSLIYQYA